MHAIWCSQIDKSLVKNKCKHHKNVLVIESRTFSLTRAACIGQCVSPRVIRDPSLHINRLLFWSKGRV